MAAPFILVVAALMAARSAQGEASLHDEHDEAVVLLQRRARVKARAEHSGTSRHGHRRGLTQRGNGYTLTSLVYGKYFEDCATRDTSRDLYSAYPTECKSASQNVSRDTGPNTVHVFSPDGGEAPRPVVVHIHGGGFIGGDAWSGPESWSRSLVESLLDNGITFASVHYRFVGTTYQYQDSEGKMREEEFVDVADDGTLFLSPTMLLAEYKPLVSWQELMPKCVYDASRALDYLLEHADELEIDSQRIGFFGDSAGTAEIAYLSLVYPGLPGHPAYTVVSISLLNSQLIYPFLPMLDPGWALLEDELGEEAPFSTVVSKDNCSHIFGVVDDRVPDSMFACPRLDVCNMTWSEEAAARFCGDNWGSATLGSVRRWYTWPMDTPYRRGLAKLWDIATNFETLRRKHDEPPLLVYVRNTPHSARDANGIIHTSLWARAYARVLEALPRELVQYVVYYGYYPGMPTGEQGQHFGDYSFKSSFGWSSELDSHAGLPRPSLEEIVLLHCKAMGLTCDV